jgi:hypothetical protein
MTENELKKIKSEGEQRALREKISSLFWDIKKCADDGMNEYPNHVLTKINRIATCIEDIVTIMKEVKPY